MARWYDVPIYFHYAMIARCIPNMNSRFTIFYFPILYIVVMGISNLIVKQYFHATYGSPEYVEAMLPFLLILAIGPCLFFLLRRERLTPKQQGEPRYAPYLILFIPLVAMSAFFVVTHGSTERAFLIPLALTLLVGVGEEMTFRRILFAGLLKDMDFRRALLFSSIAFSLLHSVNVLAGVSFLNMLIQLVMTFLSGLFFGLMYYYTRNIALLIIGHWLWDYLLLGGAVVKVSTIGVVMAVLTALELIITIVLLWMNRRLLVSSAEPATA